jgi:hypothetical protein
VIVAPQKQHAVPSCVCVGIIMPAAHIARLHAVRSRSSRQA